MFKKPEVPVLCVDAMLVGTEVPHVLDEAGLELVLRFGNIKQGGTLHWFVVVRGIDLPPHPVVHHVTPEMVDLGLGVLLSVLGQEGAQVLRHTHFPQSLQAQREVLVSPTQAHLMLG